MSPAAIHRLNYELLPMLEKSCSAPPALLSHRHVHRGKTQGLGPATPSDPNHRVPSMNTRHANQ